VHVDVGGEGFETVPVGSRFGGLGVEDALQTEGKEEKTKEGSHGGNDQGGGGGCASSIWGKGGG
jgi:hypothetical protein